MWLIPDQLFFAYSQESGCCQKEFAYACPTVGLRPFLNGKPTPRPSSWRGWKIRAWSRRLFGAATFAISTENNFVEWWICSALGRRVSRTVAPANAKATQTAVVSREARDRSFTCCASYPSQDPPWSSSKMSQLGFAADGFDNSATNFLDWVTASLNLSKSVRATLERVTNASGSSSWPSCRANEGRSGDYQNDYGDKYGTRRPTLNGAAKSFQGWPTPNIPNGGRTMTAEDISKKGMTDKGKRQVGLENVAKQWNTPHCPTAHASDNSQTTYLDRQAKKWPSPRAEDSESCGNHPGRGDALNQSASFWKSPRASESEHAGRQLMEHDGQTGLLEQANNWPTPGANDQKGSAKEGQRRSQLDEAAEQKYSRQNRAQPVNGKQRSATIRIFRPRLNPAFVCWLMGWPYWWTKAEPISCAAREMESWRFRLRSRLAFYLRELKL